jgi:hypothetical protein
LAHPYCDGGVLADSENNQLGLWIICIGGCFRFVYGLRGDDVTGTSLIIDLVALASAIALGDFLAGLMKGSRIGEIIRESFTIGGWVSMWRPLEIFLYDWWPIRDEARLSDRLAAMPVRIRYLNTKEPDAWKGDWPVVSPRSERATGDAQPRTLNQAS